MIWFKVGARGRIRVKLRAGVIGLGLWFGSRVGGSG